MQCFLKMDKHEKMRLVSPKRVHSLQSNGCNLYASKNSLFYRICKMFRIHHRYEKHVSEASATGRLKDYVYARTFTSLQNYYSFFQNLNLYLLKAIKSCRQFSVVKNPRMKRVIYNLHKFKLFMFSNKLEKQTINCPL